MNKTIFEVSPTVARKLLQNVYGVDFDKPIDKKVFTKEDLDAIEQLFTMVNKK